MHEIRFRCLGLTPIIMNQSHQERLTMWQDDPGQQAPLPDPEADFNSRIYRGPDGRVALHRDMLMSSLRNSGYQLKLGARKISVRRGGSLISSLLKIVEEWILVDGGQPGTEPEFVRDVRSATRRIGRKKMKIRLVRPKAPIWGFSFTARVRDREYVQVVIHAAEVAGTESGLGDFRPSLPNRSGWKSPFGQFKVESAVVVDVEPTAEELAALQIPDYEELEMTVGA